MRRLCVTMRDVRYVRERLDCDGFVLDHLGTNGVQGSSQSGQESVGFVGDRRSRSGVGGNGLTLGFGNLARDELVEKPATTD